MKIKIEKRGNDSRYFKEVLGVWKEVGFSWVISVHRNFIRGKRVNVKGGSNEFYTLKEE